jgi:hypothetical protein
MVCEKKKTRFHGAGARFTTKISKKFSVWFIRIDHLNETLGKKTKKNKISAQSELLITGTYIQTCSQAKIVTYYVVWLNADLGYFASKNLQF